LEVPFTDLFLQVGDEKERLTLEPCGAAIR